MKMTKKSLWSRFTAVAAAAACAITATAVGVSIPKADIAYLWVRDDNWAIDATNDSKSNSIVMTGDGSYSISVENTKDYPAANWSDTISDDGNEMGVIKLVLQEDWMASGTAYTDITVESLVMGDTEILNPTYELLTNQYPQYVVDGAYEYLHSAVLKFDSTQLGIGESVTVNFTIGEKAAETTTAETTTVTTTTTAASTEDTAETTTATTAASTEDTAETTTATTAASTEKTEETTTTTTTTTTETTTTTTTKVTTTSVTLETEIDFVQTKDEDGNPCIEIDTMGADSVTVVMKVLTSDTQATLAFCGTYDGEWSQKEYAKLAVASDKTVTQSYTIPDNLDGLLKIASYWPTSVTFQSVTLKYDKAPVVTEPVTTTAMVGEKIPTQTQTIGLTNDDSKDEITVDLKDMVYVVISAEGVAGKLMSGGFYAGKDAITWDNEAVDASGAYVIAYENVNGESSGSYQIYHNGGKSDTKVTYKTYRRFDASLNDVVNESDVLAILRYLKRDAADRTYVENVVCDINEDDVIGMADAVSLVKQLLAQ